MAGITVANPLSNVEWVSPVAQIMDIFPFVGSVKNVIDLFLRFCWKPENPAELPPLSKAYYNQLHEKNLLENILLIIPVFGTVMGIVIFMAKQGRGGRNRIDYAEQGRARLEQAQRELQDVRDNRIRLRVELQEDMRRRDREREEHRVRADRERQETMRRLDEEHQAEMRRIGEERRQLEENILEYRKKMEAREQEAEAVIQTGSPDELLHLIQRVQQPIPL